MLYFRVLSLSTLCCVTLIKSNGSQ